MSLSSPGVAAALVGPLILALWIRLLAPERPSLGRTLMLFAIGGVSIIPASWLAGLLTPDVQTGVRSNDLAGLEASFFEAALPEEIVRLAIVGLALLLTRRRSGLATGVVLGAVVGSGFAAAESMLGVLGGESLLTIAVGRSLTAVGHACYGIIMGFYLGRALTGPRGRLWIDGGLALGLPVLLHTLYDFPILTDVPGSMNAPTAGGQPPPWHGLALMAMTPVVFVLEVALAWVAVRRARRPLLVPRPRPVLTAQNRVKKTIDAVLVVVVLCGGFLAWQTGRERGRLSDRYNHLARLTGELTIPDPSKAYLQAIETGEPLSFAWRMYLPPNYKLAVSSESGWSSWTSTTGPNEFIGRVRFRETQQGSLEVYAHLAGGSSTTTIGTPELARLLRGRSDKLRVEQAGRDGLTEIDPTKPLTLCRLILPDDLAEEARKTLGTYEQQRLIPVIYDVTLGPKPSKP